MEELREIHSILKLFCTTTSMKVNSKKSTINCSYLQDNIADSFVQLFLFSPVDLNEGLKYLGFYIKPNGYRSKDRQWMICKIERSIHFWCHRWLTRGGRLTLIKAVLEAIPVY